MFRASAVTKSPGRVGVRLAAARAAGSLVLASCLCACAPSTKAEELVFWAMGSEAEVAESMLADFREAHPGIALRVQRLPWSAAHEKLLTAFVGGSMPDVFQLGNTWVAELAALGALEPLDARLDASTTLAREAFFEGAVEPNLIDGRLVALPWYVDTRILFYRRDLLEQAGSSSAPRDWEEWKGAMQRLRESARGEGGQRFGIFLPVDEWQTPVILALQQGATLLRDGDRYGNMRSAEVRRAFEFYTGLFASGLAPQRSAAQLSNLYREFAAGYFGFFVTGPWNLGEIARRLPELDEAWATAPMPAPHAAKSGLSIAGGASLAISASSPRKEAAWKLIEHLGSAEVQAEFRRRTGDLPSRRDAWQLAGEAEAPKSAAFRTQLEHLASTPKLPEWERIAAKITLHLERILRGDATLDEGLADLDADIDAILEKRRWMLARAGGAEGAGL